jgi:hypothetical protein
MKIMPLSFCGTFLCNFEAKVVLPDPATPSIAKTHGEIFSISLRLVSKS